MIRRGRRSAGAEKRQQRPGAGKPYARGAEEARAGGPRGQAPRAGTLARPLRWFLTETVRAFHRVRGRRGHFWERRYRACLVEDDTYGLAVLRSLDRNPVRAGLVQDPSTSPWSSCAAYAQGTPNPLVTFHPSYLGLSRDPEGRQRAYAALLAPNGDPKVDGHDSRWTTKRAVGRLEFLARHGRAPRTTTGPRTQ